MEADDILSLELFTKVRDDAEKRKYLILGGLKRISSDYQKNRVYPSLAKLIELRRILQDVMSRLEDLRKDFPRRISCIDLERMEITHDVVFVDGTDIAAVEDLIRWALPEIDRVINEGAAIHEFVESELKLEPVGIVPEYRDSGYFFLPDNAGKSLRLYRFDTSIFRSAGDRYRSLNTRFLESMPMGEVAISPNSIKLELIQKLKELPNPATYAFDTRLDFPYRETIFPVASRMLMQQIFA